MAKSANQKTKLLYLVKILEEQSDEAHPLSIQQLVAALSVYNIASKRKSLYDDIEALQQFGYDIVVQRGRCNRYYLGGRAFQLPELKMLVDVAQSAKFITAKKSGELIRKISALTSKHEALLLQRQVFVHGRVKTMNESIYYTVDLLQTAMAMNRKITCKYSEWAIDSSARQKFIRRWRHGGKPYNLSAWSLLWNEENYYLAAFDSHAGIIKHYRVDKLDSIQLTDQPRDGAQAFENLDMASYAGRTFGMFGGEETDVTLQFTNRLIGVAVDRFGKDILIFPKDEGYFTLHVKAVVSPQFLAWVLGFGDEIKILSPPNVANELCATIERVQKLYSTK